jgi:hypothetical protein
LIASKVTGEALVPRWMTIGITGGSKTKIGITLALAAEFAFGLSGVIDVPEPGVELGLELVELEVEEPLVVGVVAGFCATTTEIVAS